MNIPRVDADKPMLLYHDGALGDMLLSLPCIRRVGALHGAPHFIGRADVGVLLRESGLVATASSAAEARYASLYSGTPDAVARDFLAGFGRAFVFTVDPDAPLVHSLQSVLPETRVVRTLPPQDSGFAVEEFRSSQIGGDRTESYDPLLPVPVLHMELAAGMLSRAGYDGQRPVLAVHPGSGSRKKNWPLVRFFGVLDLCRERSNVFVLLFSGPAEEGEMQDEIEAFARLTGNAMHVANADLPAVAALLRASTLYFGNDSGVSHLASAVGCPSVVLYGPTDPFRWRPAGAPVEALRAADLADLSVPAVAERVLQVILAR